MANGVKWALTMGPATFKAFAGSACAGAVLTPGCIAWMPYGHAAILVTKAQSFAPSVCMHVPFLNTTLAKGYNLIELLAAYNRDLVASMPKYPWASEFIEWTNGLMASSGSKDGGQKVTLALTGPPQANTASDKDGTQANLDEDGTEGNQAQDAQPAV